MCINIHVCLVAPSTLYFLVCGYHQPMKPSWTEEELNICLDLRLLLHYYFVKSGVSSGMTLPALGACPVKMLNVLYTNLVYTPSKAFIFHASPYLISLLNCVFPCLYRDHYSVFNAVVLCCFFFNVFLRKLFTKVNEILMMTVVVKCYSCHCHDKLGFF